MIDLAVYGGLFLAAFTAATLLGINPFDQFGVELGKRLTRELDDPEHAAGFDPSTRDLIVRARL